MAVNPANWPVAVGEGRCQTINMMLIVITGGGGDENCVKLWKRIFEIESVN